MVITGSFNFTEATDTTNAEKVVVLDGPQVATCFAQKWESWRVSSRALEVE